MTTNLDWKTGEWFGAEVKADLFGGNLLIDRDRPDGTYDTVFNDLGLTNVRYPGGTITEWYFDINDPDKARAWDEERGDYRDLLPLSEFLTWAGSRDYGVSLVLPTGSLMTGPDGDQVPKSSAYDDIKAYVLDVLSGKYGDARIDAIELGNEYWLGAELNVTEYARIADLMARAVQDAIDTFRTQGSAPENWIEPEIAVQVGQYGRHSTAPGWQQNQYLMAALSDEAAEAIDAVVIHYYARRGFEDLPEFAYYFDRLDDWAGEDRFADIEYHITEWSTENWDTTERGLRQASSMIWMVSEMVARGVDQAHVWPVQQNTDNDLSGDEGQTDLTAAGEGLRLLAESLVGKTLDRRLHFDGGVGYLYRSESETVVLLNSRSETAQTVVLDTEDMGVAGRYHWSVQLGVDGDANDANAVPELTVRADLGGVGGALSLDIGAYETIRVTFGKKGPGTIAGSAGADGLFGSDAAEKIEGRNGSDTILGGDGADTIDGGDGDDSIDGGRGADLVLAGAGDDVVRGGDGADLIDLGSGDDRFFDTDQGGSDGADKIFGGDGNDTLQGRGGDDGLSGDAGDDSILGGAGKDGLFGQSGDDTIRGGEGADDIDGGSGDDLIVGGTGHDLAQGGAGNDTIVGEEGNDVLFGNQGNDHIFGGLGENVMSGGDGHDILSSGSGDDILSGGDGNDTLESGAGADTFVFDRDDGHDLITDFSGRDLIDLRGQGLSFDELTITRNGPDSLIAFAGTQITLVDLGRDADPSDFLFF